MERKRMKKVAALFVGGLMAMALTMGVFASGNDWSEGISTRVNGWNGSGDSPSRTRSSSSVDVRAEIENYTHSVVRNVNTDARLQNSSGSGAWRRNLTRTTSNVTYTLVPHAQHTRNSSVFVRFSSDLTTSTNYTVTYDWRPR
jgi:hypothetical protein